MNRPASYTHIEHDPLLGSTEWTITACQPCDGTGRVWHPGCGDNDTTCNRCDGMGETATSRTIFNQE